MRAILSPVVFLLAMMAAATPAHPADKIPLKIDEVTSALTMPRNMHSYSRTSGILADLARNVAKVASATNNASAASAATSAEDLINEAGLSASEGDYDTSFGLLEKAAKILLDIIAKINAGA